MRIYLAGPLFTAPEIRWNQELAISLRSHGHKVWLPQEHAKPDMDAEGVFKSDVEGMDWCEVILACLDQADPDSGTSWELGYCWEKKLCLYYRSDFRNTGDWTHTKINLMLAKSTTEVIPKEYTANSLAREVDKVLKLITSELKR